MPEPAAHTTGRPWTYEEALEVLDGRVDLETLVSGRVIEPTLDRMRALAAAMGDPQHAYPVVHVTGTNGKGSTVTMAAALLGARGLSVGTYTSPNLERVNERIAWNGEPIADDALAEALEAVVALEPVVGVRARRFELLTAAAYRWFADVAVDVAVVEVGLGGRWDPTNVADGRVAVVTNVALDHTEVLGPTRAGIAAEKAGIVKPGATLVLGETDPELVPVFTAPGPAEVWLRGREFAAEGGRVAVGGRAVDLRTPGGRYEEVFLPVHGAHQEDNAALSLAAAEAFFGAPLAEDVVREAFGGLRLPGRMEVVGRRPLVLLDGAHNPAGARVAAAALEDFGPLASRVLVVGMLGGRDPVEILRALDADRARLVVACAPRSPRALPAAEVAAAARSLGVEAESAGSVTEALDRALEAAREDDVVLVTGSLYLVGDARAVLRSRFVEGAP